MSTRKKFEDVSDFDSDISDSEEEGGGTSGEKISTKEMISRMYMNQNKMKTRQKILIYKTIPKMEKNIEKMKERIEEMERKEKETDGRIENIEAKNIDMEDKTNNIEKTLNTHQRNIADMGETIDLKLDKDSSVIMQMEKKVKKLEKISNENVILKEFREELNKKIGGIRAEMISMMEKNPNHIIPSKIQPIGTDTVMIEGAQGPSILEEIQQTSLMNFRQAVNTPARSNPVELPPREVFNPITTQTVADVVKIAASNIGIGNVSDLTIRRFSKRQDSMRLPKEEVWTGVKFESARQLFVRFYLTQILRFPESTIRYKNVRFCREAHKGILWIESDPSFIKSMNIRAAEVKNKEVNLVMFTPGPAFERVKAMRKKCEELRNPNPDLIKTQIRIGKEDFEIFVKDTRRNPFAKYEFKCLKKLDPESSIPPIKEKKMNSDEVKEYFDAHKRAIEEATRTEDENKAEEDNETPDSDAAVPFLEPRRRQIKRKVDDRTPEKEEPNKHKKQEGTVNIETTMTDISKNVGTTSTESDSDKSDSDSDSNK